MYAGRKVELAPKIVRHIPNDIVEFREPFLGGAGVLTKILKDHEKGKFPKLERLWLNDLNINVYSIWKATRDHHPELLQKILEYRRPTVGHFFECKGELRFRNEKRMVPKTKDELIDVAFKSLFIQQASHSGQGMVAGPRAGYSQKSKKKIDYYWNASKWRENMKWHHDQFETFDKVTITCEDFSGLLKGKRKNTFVFADPPYRRENLYENDFNDNDHKRLAALLKKSNHEWLLSYGEDDLIRSLYEDWCRIRTFPATNAGQNQYLELLIQPSAV